MPVPKERPIELREAHQLKLTTKTQIAQREGMHKETMDSEIHLTGQRQTGSLPYASSAIRCGFVVKKIFF